MKYLCSVWFDGTVLDKMDPDEKARLDREGLDYLADLKRGGQLLAAEALQSPATAVTVRVRGGKMSVTDGPFIETKEHLGGFVLIEARDLNEAIRIAGDLAFRDLGGVEIRPIYEIPGSSE
jgi:hypothetical protein